MERNLKPSCFLNSSKPEKENNKVTSDEGYCSARKDETHCECWWDGDKPCCSCGYNRG